MKDQKITIQRHGQKRFSCVGEHYSLHTDGSYLKQSDEEVLLDLLNYVTKSFGYDFNVEVKKKHTDNANENTFKDNTQVDFTGLVYEKDGSLALLRDINGAKNGSKDIYLQIKEGQYWRNVDRVGPWEQFRIVVASNPLSIGKR